MLSACEFYDHDRVAVLSVPISLMERQANGEHVNVVLHPPEGFLPCFASEAALAHWLQTLCAQQHLDLSTLYF